MSLWNSILADASAGYFGNTTAFGDPRDVFINSVNKSGTTLTAGPVLQGTTLRSSYIDQGFYGNIDQGGSGNDYVTAYNPINSGIDYLIGGAGADNFVAGDQFGAHYTNPYGLTNSLAINSFAIVLDYNANEGDFVQLSAAAFSGYTARETYAPGSGVPNAILMYNNKPIVLFLNTPLSSLRFTQA